MRLARLLLSVVLCLPLFAQTSFMVGNEGGNLAPQVYEQLAAGNVKYVRLNINWPQLNPAPDVYDWTIVDREITAATKAGLHVYANLMWAPRHASEGIPAYEEYLKGCTVWDLTSTVTFLIGDQTAPDVSQPLNPKWARRDVFVVPRGGTITIPAPGILANDGDHGKNSSGAPLSSVVQTVTKRTPTKHGSFILYHDGSLTYTHDGSDSTEDGFRYWVWGLPNDGDGGSIHFASDDYEYCRIGSVPHIDPTAVAKVMKALIDRWGHVLDYYGAWNEPGIDMYWPARVQEGIWTPGDYDRLIKEVITPFTDTVRMFDPSAKLVGPECDSSDCLRKLLSKEQAAGKRWFDIISFHPYPWTDDFNAVGGWDFWPEAAMHRLDIDFKPVIDPYIAGRPAWSTELGLGYRDPKAVDFMIAVTRAIQARPWVSMHEFHDSRAFFTLDSNLQTGPFEPNDLLKYMQSQKPVRRRAVRHPSPIERDKQP